LTTSELRLLPLPATSLSLDEIGQELEMPPPEVLALARSTFVKLDALGANAKGGGHLRGSLRLPED